MRRKNLTLQKKDWPSQQEDNNRPSNQQWNLCSFKNKPVHVALPEYTTEEAYRQITKSQNERSRDQGPEKEDHTDDRWQVHAKQTSKRQTVMP